MPHDQHDVEFLKTLTPKRVVVYVGVHMHDKEDAYVTAVPVLDFAALTVTDATPKGVRQTCIASLSQALNILKEDARANGDE